MRGVRTYLDLKDDLLHYQGKIGFDFLNLFKGKINKEEVIKEVNRTYSLINSTLDFVNSSFDSRTHKITRGDKFDWDTLKLLSTILDKKMTIDENKFPEVIFVSSPMACQFAALMLNQLELSTGRMTSIRYSDDYNKKFKDYLIDKGFKGCEEESILEIQKYVSFKIWSDIWTKVKLAILNSIENFPKKEHAIYKIESSEFAIRRSYLDDLAYEYKNELVSYGVCDIILLKKFCIISEFPKRIEKNNESILHSAKGPAIEWRDGFGMYFWNGVKVPKEWIKNRESITSETISLETNIERRRCLMEILGHEKFFKLMNVFCLDDTIDDCGKPMKLFRTKEIDSTVNEYLFYLLVVDPSTDREYFISVPPCYDVQWAKAATFNHQKIQYRQGDVGLLNIDNPFEKPIIET